MRARFFWKKSFCPKNLEERPSWVKNRLFWIKWKIWCWIFTEFRIRIWIACCVSANWIFGKTVLRCRPKCSQAIRLQDFQIRLLISPEQISKIAQLCECWHKFMEIKSWSKILGWAWSRMHVVCLTMGL